MGVMNKFMAFFGLQDEEEDDANRRDRLEAEHDDATVHELRRHRGNVVSIHQQKHTRMVLSEPRSYEEAQDIADHLRSRRPVLVNLQRVRPDQAMRMVDFLSGTVYALNGHIAKVGPNIFVCTPESVELEGTITEMLNSDNYT
jgi:cell division inhibitor SepF